MPRRAFIAFTIAFFFVGVFHVGAASPIASMFDDMRSGAYRQSPDMFAFPKISWTDIPELLTYSESTSTLKSFPINAVSSIHVFTCSEGMMALWLIEGARQGGRFPSQTPECYDKDKTAPPSAAFYSTADQTTVAAAYKKWWATVKGLSRTGAWPFSPLKGTSLTWFMGRTPENATDKTRELHLSLSPKPHLSEGQKQIGISQWGLSGESEQSRTTKWVLYLPNDVPIDMALDVFGMFQTAAYRDVAVRPEGGEENKSERDIRVSVGRTGPIEIVTEFVEDDPASLRKYTNGIYPPNLLVAECEVETMTAVLRPLLAVPPKRHVIFRAADGREPMPPERYLRVLARLKEAGVETVSFWGVHME